VMSMPASGEPTFTPFYIASSGRESFFSRPMHHQVRRFFIKTGANKVHGFDW